MNGPYDSEVLICIENYLGHITLNRPKRINALTLDMIHTVQQALTARAADRGCGWC